MGSLGVEPAKARVHAKYSLESLAKARPHLEHARKREEDNERMRSACHSLSSHPSAGPPLLPSVTHVFVLCRAEESEKAREEIERKLRDERVRILLLPFPYCLHSSLTVTAMLIDRKRKSAQSSKSKRRWRSVRVRRKRSCFRYLRVLCPAAPPTTTHCCRFV